MLQENFPGGTWARSFLKNQLPDIWLPRICFPKNDLYDNVLGATSEALLLGLIPFTILLLLLYQRHLSPTWDLNMMCSPGVQNLLCLQSNGHLQYWCLVSSLNRGIINPWGWPLWVKPGIRMMIFWSEGYSEPTCIIKNEVAAAVTLFNIITSPFPFPEHCQRMHHFGRKIWKEWSGESDMSEVENNGENTVGSSTSVQSGGKLWADICASLTCPFLHLFILKY